MREGMGTSKGELLAVQVEQAAELVEWGGYKFLKRDRRPDAGP